MSAYAIPFNRPCFSGDEYAFMGDALSRLHISGDGHFTKQCQTLLEESLGVQKALLTTSCTDALEMSALLLDICDGDEVIVPSFTFVSTANAFALRGARILFADICPQTLNMEARSVANLITSRTRAIVPVHYAGVGCDMIALTRLANDSGAALVEDNAHGLFGTYRGKPLGTFGEMATQSFHETKNFTCGEGGALLINNAERADRAEILREKGTNRSLFFRGQVDKYTWVDIGSSFLPSDLLAACLFAQLQRRNAIQNHRKRLWDAYFAGLADWAQESGIGLPIVPDTCQQAYHMFYLLLPSLQDRQDFIAHMRERGIQCVFHYLPLNCAPMGLRHGASAGDCPVSEHLSDLLVRLPFFNNMSDTEQERVLAAAKAFRPRSAPDPLLQSRQTASVLQTG